MAIDALTHDAATARATQREAPLSAIIRSPTEEVYDQPGEMSFMDFLDIINPLQHLPVVGTIYRSITGDTIKPAQQVIGGMLWGGPLGGATSIFNAIVEQSTGKGVEGHAMAALGFGGEEPATAVASAEAPAAATADTANTGTAAPAVPAAMAAAQVAAAPAAAGTITTPVPFATAAAAPRDAFAAGPGDHRPSRMPARDTILANTMQAKHTAPLTTPTPAAAAAKAAPATGGGAEKPADDRSAAAAAPEMLSDVMMRNLAKYEAAKKASMRSAPSNVRVSG